AITLKHDGTTGGSTSITITVNASVSDTENFDWQGSCGNGTTINRTGTTSCIIDFDFSPSVGTSGFFADSYELTTSNQTGPRAMKFNVTGQAVKKVLSFAEGSYVDMGYSPAGVMVY